MTRPAPSADDIPADLQKALHENRAAQAVFDKLPPSHRREYVNYITEAKKPETRARRIGKTIEMLLASACG